MGGRARGSRGRGAEGLLVGHEVVSRRRLALVSEDTVPYDGVVSGEDPAALARFFWERLFHDEPREVVGVGFLDRRGRLTGYVAAFAGTINRSPVEPREILAAALLHGARGIVLVHNHPSGSPDPSVEDRLFTRRLQAAAWTVGVELLDHVVVGAPEVWISLRQRGDLRIG